jgi:DMSO/TMAO reductase YedYZ heme-binding membrane subunit
LAHSIFHFLRAGVLGDLGEMYFQSIERDWAILLGTISFLIMLPLFLTSTNFACKKMGYKSWKFLQRFTHVAFVLVAIHVSFTAFPQHGEIDKGPLVTLTIYALGYLWLFIKTRKKQN